MADLGFGKGASRCKTALCVGEIFESHTHIYGRLYLLLIEDRQLVMQIIAAQHIMDYSSVGHPYCHNYMITSNLCMSPLMAQWLGEAEFVKAKLI